MRQLIISLLLTLGATSGAQANRLAFDNTFAAIDGEVSIFNNAVDLEFDAFTDDTVTSSLPLSGATTASSANGSTADSFAGADDGFVSISAEVFGAADETAEATAFANYNASVTGTGGPVTLFVAVDHQPSAFGDAAINETELMIDVFDMNGASLVELFLMLDPMIPLDPTGPSGMFSRTFALAAGAVADIEVSLSGFFSSALDSEVFSVTAVDFSLIAAPVPATPTVVLLLLAAGSVWASRARSAVR